ncbi:hypothetical protein AZA_72798 [Nitrospirillum viridazoti Y2]|nr:hypothetical protein AZA_72798 [Nitrospirillum amazonense Y2]
MGRDGHRHQGHQADGGGREQLQGHGKIIEPHHLHPFTNLGHQSWAGLAPVVFNSCGLNSLWTWFPGATAGWTAQPSRPPRHPGALPWVLIFR